MCGKGGNGGNATFTVALFGGNGGGALTGHKKLYIEASDIWTAVFSAASGGTCSFANIAHTLQAQNGYNGVSNDNDSITAGGSAHAGFDRVIAGKYGGANTAINTNNANGAAFGGDSELGIGGENGLFLNSNNGGNGKGYGAGGGSAWASTATGAGGTGAPAVIIIRG